MRVAIPFSKYGHVGDRWKFDPNIPDEALYPRCKCGKYLKLEPDIVVLEPDSNMWIAWRECVHCGYTNKLPYYGENHC